MLLSHQGQRPHIDATSRIAPNATISGDVFIGPNCSVGFGAVVTAESGPVVIGANCVIMDTAVLRGVRGSTLRLGNNVLVGPRAYLTGCAIEDDVFLATGCTVFNGARVGRGSEVRINGIVHLRTLLPPGATVPIGWVAIGNPAKILSPDQHEEIWAVQQHLDFPKFVFGVERPPDGESIMPDLMPRYAAALIKRHAGDRDITGEG